MISRFERFSFIITDIYRNWHRITTEEMEEFGLKGGYSVYFTTLYRHPEGLTAVQLGELCNRDKADVSRAIATLEKKKLIQKVFQQKVYRSSWVLTETGLELAERISEKAKAAVEYASRGLPEEKRETFYEALELISNNLQNLSREGLPRK